MSVNEVDTAMTPAALVVVSTAPELLHKSPEQVQVSIPNAVVHPSATPVKPQDLVTKIL